MRPLDGAVADAHHIDLSIGLATPTRHEREAPDALLAVVAGLRYASAGADDRVALCRGRIVCALCAPLTVLGAVATLCIDDGAGIECLPHEVLGDLVCCLV